MTNRQMFYTTESSVSSNRILYTPSIFAKSSCFYVQEIGSLVARKAHKSVRNNLDSYLFFFVKSGSGSLIYRGRTYCLFPGDMVFLDCRQMYVHETDEKNLWELSWIHFDGEAMPAIYEKYVSRGGSPVFHPSETEKYRRLHEELFALASSDDHIRDMRINAKLSELLVYLMEESWNPEMMDDGLKRNKLFPIKEYLEENYAKPIVLDELSEHFGISKFYLTRVFKEQYGQSINQYLLQIRITKAKNMLRFTEEKIETIGRVCGLGEPNYFSRTFKKMEGISPLEYRKKW